MGNSSSENESETMFEGYSVKKRENNGYVVIENESSTQFYLKEACFHVQKDYEEELGRMKQEEKK